MKYTIIIMAALLTGCGDYKCIDGVVYHKLNEDAWVVSGVYHGVKCATEK